MRATATLRTPDGTEHVVSTTYKGKDHTHASVVFHWTDGNYGCDCNRRILIEQLQHCHTSDDDGDEECGNDIKLIRLKIEKTGCPTVFYKWTIGKG